jgi:hypothetical protein
MDEKGQGVASSSGSVNGVGLALVKVFGIFAVGFNHWLMVSFKRL